MTDEILEHFDEKNQLLGSVSRKEAYEKGLRQRAAHIFLVNSQGKFLIQQRSDTKATWGGCYDLSSAETASPGESGEETARRGLREELTISESIPLHVVRNWYDQTYIPENTTLIVRGFIQLYLGKYDGPITLDPTEVQWFNWLAPEEIDVLLVDLRVQVTPWLKADWRFLRENFAAYMSKIK